MQNNPDRIGLIVEGGMGDNIMHTPAIRALRKKYPNADLGVACVYPQLLKYNKNINKLIDARFPSSFYNDYCFGNKFAFRPKPYNSRLYAYGRKHYIDYVCDDCGVEADSHKLDLQLTAYEKEDAESFVNSLRAQSKGMPIVLFQPSASFDPINKRKIIRLKDYPMSLCRKLAEMLKDKVFLCQTGFPEEEPVGCNTVFSPDIRRVAALVKYCDAFISVDSNLPHLAAVWEKRGVVLWGRTNPHAFKYAQNDNIFMEGVCEFQPCGRPEGGFFDMMVANDASQGPSIPWDCEHNSCMYAISPEAIIASLSKVLEDTLAVKKEDEVKKED